MRAVLVLLGILAIIGVILLATGMISIDQTREAAIPKLEVEGGKAPEFDVDVGEIDVTTTNRTIEVPDVDVRKAEDAEAR